MSKTKWYAKAIRRCERSVAIFLALALALSLSLVTAVPAAGSPGSIELPDGSVSVTGDGAGGFVLGTQNYSTSTIDAQNCYGLLEGSVSIAGFDASDIDTVWLEIGLMDKDIYDWYMSTENELNAVSPDMLWNQSVYLIALRGDVGIYDVHLQDYTGQRTAGITGVDSADFDFQIQFAPNTGSTNGQARHRIKPGGGDWTAWTSWWTYDKDYKDDWQDVDLSDAYLVGQIATMSATSNTFSASYSNVQFTQLSESWVDSAWASQANVDAFDPNLSWQYDAFDKIQDGINAVTEGGTINVAAGEYTETVDVDRQVTIIGAGAGNTIVTAADYNHHVFEVNANGVIIKNLTATGANRDAYASSYKWRSGVFVNDVDNCIIDGVTAEDNNAGIYLYKSGGSTITGCTATNNQIVGIFLNRSNGNEITGNTADANIARGGLASQAYSGIGIRLGGQNLQCSNNRIIGNTANSNIGVLGYPSGIGIYVNGSSNVLIDNTANENDGPDMTWVKQFPGVGICLQSSSGTADSHTILTGNTANSNKYAGIVLYQTHYADVTGNTVNSNQQNGLYSEGAFGNFVHDNIVTGTTATGNEIGFYLVNDASTYTSNTITNNSDVGVCVEANGEKNLTETALNYNDISGNTNYGGYFQSWSEDDELNAEKNWWGDATGADHSSNPHGTGQGGDKVSDNVDFIPWYATSTTVPGTENVSVGHSASSIIAYSDTIQGGIDAALAGGDTILVKPGEYIDDENGDGDDLDANEGGLVADIYEWEDRSGLTLKSTDGPEVTIIKSRGEEGDAAIRICGPDVEHPATGVTVDGFTVYNTGDANSGMGIFIGGRFAGDKERPANGNTVKNCIIGSHADQSLSPTLGVYLYNTTGNIIQNNIIYKARNEPCCDFGTGIIVWGGWNEDAASSNNQILNNEIYDSGYGSGEARGCGIFIGGFPQLDYSNHTISGNTITGSGKWGIELWNVAGCDTIKINYNNIYDNGVGGVGISDCDATVDATDNWWGANNGPSDQGPGSGDAVSANVGYDPWIQFVLEADSTEIVADGTSQSDLTARLVQSSDGTIPEGINQLPQFAKVTFATDKGEVGSSSVTKDLTNGQAIAILTSSTTVETATVTAEAKDVSDNPISGATSGTTVDFIAGPTATVTIVADPTSIPANGSSTSTITATVNDQYGRPAEDGTEVTFTTDHGTFASATITKNTLGGKASVTLTSESSTETVIATVTATANGVSDAAAVFFIAEGGAEAEESTIGIVSDSGTIEDTATGGAVTIDATGDHIITTAKYEDNPGGIPTFEATGNYYDVHLDDDTNVTSLTIEFCPADEDTIIYYWDGTSWRRASNQSYSDGCIVVTITGDTFPSLSDLSGLPFASGTPYPPPPVGGEAYPVNKLAILAPWIAIGMAIIAGSFIVIRRRRAES